MLRSRLYQFSPVLFFLLISRAALDPILDVTKVGSMGFGAVLNAVVVGLFLLTVARNKLSFPSSFLATWGCFIATGLLSIMLSPDKVGSARSFFAVLTYFSTFCLTYYFVQSRADFVFVLKLVIYSAFVPVFISLFQIVFPENYTGRNGFRLFGTFSHPNIFAFYLVLISSVCLYALKSKVLIFDLKFKRIAQVLFFVSLVCLLLTKTRSAWIAQAIVLSIYGFISERKYLVYLVIIGVCALMVPSVQERLVEMVSGNDVEEVMSGEALNSYAWRKLVWMASWEYILAKPIFGHGYDTFSYYFLDFFPLEETTKFDAHNTYVQLLFDVGIVGLLSYAIIFILVLSRVIKLFSIDPPGAAIILGLVCSFLVVGYSDNMLFYLSYNWYYWLVIGSVFFFTTNAAESRIYGRNSNE